LVLQAGFTLAELIVVVTIIMIVTGFSIPKFSREIDNSRLKGALQTVATAYQNARILATQNNAAYEILVSLPGIKPASMCVDLDGDGNCGPTEPATPIPVQVSLNNNSVPAGLDITTLGFSPLNTETSGMYNKQNQPTPGLGWNSLGQPCQRASATTPCAPVGWVQYLQFQRTNGSILYGAVTVSPTGRVKTWTYIPSSNGNGKWF
jgi:prepilin-type N-terminal cleavage/methylation domain-containing protein